MRVMGHMMALQAFLAQTYHSLVAMYVPQKLEVCEA